MAYSTDDPATRLAAVRAAIDKILNAQEYSTEDGRRTRYAELKQLREMEKELQAEVNQATGGVLLGQVNVSP